MAARTKMKGVGRVAFLAHLDPIQTELAQGWPVKAIYLRYAEQLEMSYQQFARYVRRYLKANPAAQAVHAAQPEQAPTTPAPAPVQEAPSPTGPKRLDVEMPRFHYDPKPLDKDDLI